MAKVSYGCDYYWYLPDKKKPFMGTTLHIAARLKNEAMEGVTLLGGRTVQQVRNEIKLCCIDPIDLVFLDDEILDVLDTYIKNGCGDMLLREVIRINQETKTELQRLAKERAAERRKKKTPAWKALHEEILEQRRKETENAQ